MLGERSGSAESQTLSLEIEQVLHAGIAIANEQMVTWRNSTGSVDPLACNSAGAYHAMTPATPANARALAQAAVANIRAGKPSCRGTVEGLGPTLGL